MKLIINTLSAFAALTMTLAPTVAASQSQAKSDGVSSQLNTVARCYSKQFPHSVLHIMADTSESFFQREAGKTKDAEIDAVIVEVAANEAERLDSRLSAFSGLKLMNVDEKQETVRLVGQIQESDALVGTHPVRAISLEMKTGQASAGLKLGWPEYNCKLQYSPWR
jgi:hypothetical protein